MDDLVQRLNTNRAPEDGIGWWVDYCGRLLKTYSQFSMTFIMDELPMDEGWVWWNFAYQDDPMHKFSGMKAVRGYIAEEAEKLVAEAKKSWLAN